MIVHEAHHFEAGEVCHALPSRDRKLARTRRLESGLRDAMGIRALLESSMNAARAVGQRTLGLAALPPSPTNVVLIDPPSCVIPRVTDIAGNVMTYPESCVIGSGPVCSFSPTARRGRNANLTGVAFLGVMIALLAARGRRNYGLLSRASRSFSARSRP